MKKLFLLTFILTSAVSHAQQKNSFGLSVSTGKGFLVKEQLEGGPSLDVERSVAVGLIYQRTLTSKVRFETGVNFYNNKILVTPMSIPNIETVPPQSYPIRLVYIPAFVRVDVLKHFFISGGLIGDIDASKDSYITSQSGIGTGLGIGGEFNVSKKIAVSINPYVNFHGVFLTKGDQYPERLVDNGIRLTVRTR